MEQTVRLACPFLYARISSAQTGTELPTIEPEITITRSFLSTLRMPRSMKHPYQIIHIVTSLQRLNELHGQVWEEFLDKINVDLAQFTSDRLHPISTELLSLSIDIQQVASVFCDSQISSDTTKRCHTKVFSLPSKATLLSKSFSDKIGR